MFSQQVHTKVLRKDKGLKAIDCYVNINPCPEN